VLADIDKPTEASLQLDDCIETQLESLERPESYTKKVSKLLLKYQINKTSTLNVNHRNLK
jgi:hypothetical protein